MKLAIVIFALLFASLSLPILSATALKRAWRRASAPAQSGMRGAVFATVLLRKVGAGNIGVVEDGRLFCEHYDTRSGDIVLSRDVYNGRSMSALAHAALQTGYALRHRDNAWSAIRLAWWNKALWIIVNAAPPLLLLLLLHPGMRPAFPFLALPCLLLIAIQVLTYPAAKAAAGHVMDIIHKHKILPPDEAVLLRRAIFDAAGRHLAAPILDCLWLRWLW